MRTRKTKKTRIGSSGNPFGLRLAAFVMAAFCVLHWTTPVSGAEKKPAAYSVVAGTVFKESGLSLPGATVTLAPEGAAGAKSKQKPLTLVSDQRGEFAFRVPAVSAKYVVSATMKGHSSETKTVSVNPEERIDVTFTLRDESK